jgi:hypothetical protein
MRLFRLSALLIFMLALAGPLAAADDGEYDEESDDCPGYAVHVRNARAYLARGEREQALVEIRLARRASDACPTEDAEETAIAAIDSSLRHP